MNNDYDSFVRLWLKLDSTRQMFLQQGHCFCIRRILQFWAREGFIPSPLDEEKVFSICRKCSVLGYDVLPSPGLYPRQHREFLRALVSELLGIGVRGINLRALDSAYREAFPHSIPINVVKKGK